MAILLMYGSHDMRHTGIPQVDSGQRDPRDRGVTESITFSIHRPLRFLKHYR